MIKQLCKENKSNNLETMQRLVVFEKNSNIAEDVIQESSCNR